MMHPHRIPRAVKPEAAKFVVRLPNGMRQEIADVAHLSRRSMNSEIVARLERSLAENNSVTAISQQPLAAVPPLHAVTDSGVQTSCEIEQRLLQAFRKLNLPKREAILQLLA